MGAQRSMPSHERASRFNEAEARTPRMAFESRLAKLRRDVRFNEAEARTPRMGVSCAGHDGAVDRMASMRPRRVRLGWSLPMTTNVASTCAASMRPRRVRLGWRASTQLHACCAMRASMRPRRVRLGWSGVSGASTERRCDRFNEAEARTPRMGWVDGHRPQVLDARFNEAEARTPRMATACAPVQSRRRRRFNEAEARTPRMACQLRRTHEAIASVLQ